jgi:hypothetical protein
MAANIFCRVCGARPYPELSLPTVVREEFDLLKLVQREGKDKDGKKINWWEPAGIGEGAWFCSQHRPGK